MVGQWPLKPLTGVRIPAPQPTRIKINNSFKIVQKEIPENSLDLANIYHKGIDRPAIVFGDYKLYIDPELSKKMSNPYPVATYGSEDSAILDEKAFDILVQYVNGDKSKLEEYLRTLTEFEINYSDNEERHQNRTPIEEEILDIMKKGGYFDQ